MQDDKPPQQLDFLDAWTASQNKAAVLGRVQFNNKDWVGGAFLVFENMRFEFARRNPTFIGEDIRIELLPIIGPPRVSAAWGALTRVIVEAGLIEEVGGWRATRIGSSHGRKSIVYRLKQNAVSGRAAQSALF